MKVLEYLNEIHNFVLQKPDVVMIVDKGGARRTTYSEFWKVVCKMACAIRKVKDSSSGCRFIPIYLPDSMEYFAAEYAIWMTGNAAVHMGVAFPKERVEYILQHCEAEFVIDAQFVEAALAVEEIGEVEMSSREDDQHCVMFYTSGSTGNPKGVLHSDKGLISALDRIARGCDLTPYKSFSSTTSCYFISVTTALSLIRLGYEIHLLSSEVKLNVNLLADYILENKIEFAHISPSLLRIFSNKSKYLKLVRATGERLVGCYSEEYAVLNGYGQTETAGPCLFKIIDKNYDNTPVGVPASGVEFVLLDDNGNEVPDGEVGELCIKSGIVPPVYYKDSDRTAQLMRFGVQHTSDLMKRLPDGDYLYIQRNDWMVKINGQRVEPGEVECVLRSIPGVKDAIVKGFTTEDLTRQYLVGYYLADDAAELGQGYLSAELTKKVPAYMVPQFFVKMDKFPLNVNNKIDRKSLLPPDVAAYKTDYAAPETDLQKTICEAFAKVLKIDKVGLDDDFFLLGGDSIRVMMLQRHLVDMKNITTIVNAGRTPRQIAAQYEEFISAMNSGADENGMYPLSDIQETYMNMCMPLEGRPLMHIRNLLLLDNEADLNKLASAIVVAVENHPGMFIRFHKGEDGVLKQKIEPETFEIVVENVSDEEFEAMKPTLVAPFRYIEEKLFSFRIFQTPAAKYLFYNIHHSIFDGESMNILLTDIERAYQGMPLEPEKDSFCNLAAEEAAIRLTPIYAEARDSFRASFSNAPRTLFLENAGSATLSLEYANLQTRAGEALSFCESAGITMNALTTAAFAFVLGRCTDSNDVVLGSQYSGRGDGRSANMVGSFAKPIPLRFRWNDNDSVDNFLHNAGEVLRDNIKNSIYKFLDLKQDGLFTSQIQFVYQDLIDREPVLCGHRSKEVVFQTNQTPSTMVVNVFRDVENDSLKLRFAYREDLFEKEFIDRMISEYDKTLARFISGAKEL